MSEAPGKYFQPIAEGTTVEKAAENATGQFRHNKVEGDASAAYNQLRVDVVKYEAENSGDALKTKAFIDSVSKKLEENGLLPAVKIAALRQTGEQESFVPSNSAEQEIKANLDQQERTAGIQMLDESLTKDLQDKVAREQYLAVLKSLKSEYIQNNKQYFSVEPRKGDGTAAVPPVAPTDGNAAVPPVAPTDGNAAVPPVAPTDGNAAVPPVAPTDGNAAVPPVAPTDGNAAVPPVAPTDGNAAVPPVAPTDGNAAVPPVAPTDGNAAVPPVAPTDGNAAVPPVAPTDGNAAVPPVAPTDGNAAVPPVAPTDGNAAVPPVAPTDGNAAVPPVAPTDGNAAVPPVAPTDGTAAVPPVAPADGTAAVPPIVPADKHKGQETGASDKNILFKGIDFVKENPAQTAAGAALTAAAIFGGWQAKKAFFSRAATVVAGEGTEALAKNVPAVLSEGGESALKNGVAAVVEGGGSALKAGATEVAEGVAPSILNQTDDAVKAAVHSLDNPVSVVPQMNNPPLSGGLNYRAPGS